MLRYLYVLCRILYLVITDRSKIQTRWNIYKFFLPPQIVGEKGWYYVRWKHKKFKFIMLALLTCVYHYQR